MASERIKSYKNKGKDVQEARRKWNECSIELRKARKDDQLMKRRNITDFIDEDPIQEKVENEEEIFQAVQSIRKRLSKERNPPINDVIHSGVLPLLVKLLGLQSNPAVQFEAAWALTNIASGNSDQTMAVVNNGSIPNFISLLSSPHMHICEQAVWALGNIAGDGSALRDLVIKSGIIPPLLALVKPDISITFLRNITWTLSNLCRNKNPSAPMEAVKTILPVLTCLLQHTDKDVVADACWSFSYITDGEDEKIEEVIKHNVVPRLVQLMDCDEVAVVVVINNGALPVLGKLLTHHKPSIVKESTWTVSNLTAGTHAQIQAVIDAGLIPHVINVLKEGDSKSKKEAIWVVSNITSGGTDTQITYLLRIGTLEPLCNLLDFKDVRTLKVLLDGIENIFLAAERSGCLEQLCLAFEEAGGLDKLEMLQSHEQSDIYKIAVDLIERFFNGYSVDDIEPGATEQGFQFGAQQNNAGNGFQF